MALVVEDGTGKSDAEAYISTADTSTYATSVGNSTWGGLSTSVQEGHLRIGAMYLDIEYGLRWHGYRTNETQALDHPRTGIVDLDGYCIDSDEITNALKYANAEAAFRSADGDTLMGDITIDASSGLIKKKIKIGPIEIDKEYGSQQSIKKRYPKIDAILQNAGLIMESGRLVRG